MPRLATPSFRVSRERRSRLLFHWDARDFSLTARSGQAATFARTATGTGTDSSGTSITWTHSAPRWHTVDYAGDSTRELVCLKLGQTSGSELIRWDFLKTPAAMTVYCDFIEDGAIAVASAAICYIGNDGNTGARFWIDSTGTYYRVRHHNGTSEVTSTLTAAPTSGQRVKLRAVLNADGSVQLHQSINGAAETSSVASGTLSLAAAWGDTRIRLSSTGTTNPGLAAHVACKVDAGVRSATDMGAD